MFKIGLASLITLSIALGGYLGYERWDDIVGILGGALIGLIVSLAAFYCFAILAAFLFKK